MTRVAVYLDNVSIGAVEGPFATGEPRLVALGVPTTINVTPGAAYSVVVEGMYDSADYWQSISIVATGG